MLISFAKRKMEKAFNKERELLRTYGTKTANFIRLRMAVLQSAAHLGLVPIQKPERCHLLDGDREGQFAVDLDHPRRLVFEPGHDPVPRLDDGGIDKAQVTAIVILDVVDYH
jgi:proteic killer suppression protein